MMFFAEPFIRHIVSKQTVQSLLAAGYTAAADRACILQDIDDHQAWATTHSSVDFTPAQVINADGTTRLDEGFTESVMGYCRSSLGTLCTLEDNAIRDPIGSLGGAYASLFAKI